MPMKVLINFKPKKPCLPFGNTWGYSIIEPYIPTDGIVKVPPPPPHPLPPGQYIKPPLDKHLLFISKSPPLLPRQMLNTSLPIWSHIPAWSSLLTPPPRDRYVHNHSRDIFCNTPPGHHLLSSIGLYNFVME